MKVKKARDKSPKRSSALHMNGEWNDPLAHTLSQNDSPYIQLLQKLPAAIYTCNAEGKITFYNEAAAILWGRHPEIGKDLWCGSWKIYNPDGTPMSLDTCPMAIALKEKRAVSGKEIIVARPDGKKLHVLPHPRPLLDDEGKLVWIANRRRHPHRAGFCICRKQRFLPAL